MTPIHSTAVFRAVSVRATTHCGLQRSHREYRGARRALQARYRSPLVQVRTKGARKTRTTHANRLSTSWGRVRGSEFCMVYSSGELRLSEVFHDNSDCKRGQEVKRDGNDLPGEHGREHCERCAELNEIEAKPP